MSIFCPRSWTFAGVRVGRTARRSPLRLVTALLLVVLGLGLPGGAGAAPSAPELTGAARPVALGGGAYEVVATGFGIDGDGQVGNETSSGHVLQANDSAVALPACTESSCPWLDLGAGPEEEWGPQTSCAEGDGLCWVEIVSNDTGECTVAPVLDVGPWFVKDNWWAPQGERTYSLPQGEPAAEAAADGADLGFGPGRSDKGYDVAYGAAIDLAGGTWGALGLGGEGIVTVQVTLLWQAGIDHGSACGGGASVPPPGNLTDDDTGDDDGGAPTTGDENASTTSSLNLRSGPSLDAEVLTVMPEGSRVTVTGGSESGFYPVSYGGTDGWASADYLSFDGDAPGSADGDDGGTEPTPTPTPDTGGDDSDGGGTPSGDTATVNSSLNLRDGPGAEFDVIEVMPEGTTVTLTGSSENGYVAVSYQGTDGWASADYLDGADASSPPDDSSGDGDATDDSGGTPSGDTATVTSSLNLRDGPSLDADVIEVMPEGATVTLTGESENGFVGVEFQGTSGWASEDYLT